MPFRFKLVLAERQNRNAFRLMSAALIAAAVAILVLLFTIVVARQTSGRVYEVSLQSQLVGQRANALLQGALDSEAAFEGLALTGRPEFIGPYERGKDAADKAETDLLAVTQKSSTVNALARNVSVAKRDMLDAIDNRIGPERNGRIVVKNPDDLSSAKLAYLRREVSLLTQAAEKQASQLNAEVARNRRRLDSMIYGLIVLFAATLSLATFFFLREAATLRAAVADLNAANAALESARAQAVEADASKTRFLAMASHDMRQPLHALTLYVSSLRRRVDGDQAKEILVNMEKAASSLTRMFSGLLDLARIEAGVLKPKFSDVSVSEVFDLLQRELREDCERARVSLHVAPTSLVVRSDPELLESVLRNLLTNAIKYAGNGRVLLGCRRAGDKVRIEVHDEGPGIPEEKLVLMFGEFVRLDRANAAAKEGLGLGLSIAGRMAKLLDAQLEVASTLGKGTVFWFTARRVAAASAVRVAPPPAMPDLGGLHVAVIDDEPESLAAMARVLEDAGAGVASFASAERYMEAARGGGAFDVIIADPVLYGQVQGASPFEAGKPAIIVTGATDPGTLTRLQASGHAWLVKPIAEEVLIAETARMGRPAAVSAAR